MDAEFLVVGGGLGGGVLAGLLARAGRRVLVLERLPSKAPLVRPEVLWPETVELLASLLGPERLAASMVPVKGLRIRRGGAPLVEIAPSTLAMAGVQPWSTDPGATRATLLARGPFEIRHGVEVVSVLKEGERVVGVRARETLSGRESDLLATWTVGDDGAHSRVREGCAIPLEARLFPVEFFCFGFDWPDSIPEGWPHAFINPAASRSCLLALGALPLPGRKGAGLAVALGRRLEEARDFTTEWDAFQAACPEVPAIVRGRSFPGDFVRVKRPWGHAERYGGDGAVLLGDAIHPVSPAGGQGANMSVQDARVLAEVFLSGVRAPVGEYERRRRPANERSISITRRAAEAFEGRGLVRVARRFARWLPKVANLPAFQAQFLRTISRAFVER